MSQLYPEVKDATSLGPRFSQALYLPIGVEGQKDAGGTATVAVPVKIGRPADADTQFGPASSLSAIVKFLLGRGVPQVTAIASASGSAPTLGQRQAAWAILEADPEIRIRLTDSVTQADHVALADSAEWAEGINNKQIAFVGMANATALAALSTAAAAIASKRAVLVAPGIYDEFGTLRSGAYAAAAVAAEVAKNSDLSDDLDTARLSGFTDVERDATGLPLFRVKAGAGTPVNDMETLLQAGVSPLRRARGGGVEIAHLRTTYTTDSTFDALMTRLIVDQLFMDVRQYVESNNFLRRGNTLANRNDLKAGVEALLAERSNWIKPMPQPDGTDGYFVAVTSSADGRQVTVSYKGEVIRGIQTVLVDAQLVIPV
jgi:hypothetical protein